MNRGSIPLISFVLSYTFFAAYAPHAYDPLFDDPLSAPDFGGSFSSNSTLQYFASQKVNVHSHWLLIGLFIMLTHPTKAQQYTDWLLMDNRDAVNI